MKFLEEVADVWDVIPVPIQIIIVSGIATYIVWKILIPWAQRKTSERVSGIPQNGIAVNNAHELMKMWKINNYHDPAQITDEQFVRTVGKSKVEYIESHAGLGRVDLFNLEIMVNDHTMSATDKSKINTAIQRKKGGRIWRGVSLD